MTVLIVKLFKIIDVKHDQREGVLVTLGPLDFLAQII